MTYLGYEKVEVTRRRPRGTAKEPSPLIKDLLAGETLLVKVEEGKTFSPGWTNRVLSRHGYKAHTRKDPDGIVVWAEPIATDEPESTDQTTPAKK